MAANRSDDRITIAVDEDADLLAMTPWLRGQSVTHVHTPRRSICLFAAVQLRLSGMSLDRHWIIHSR